MALSVVDTFARFVDELADGLDDHGATGEDLAARVFLSRFHFDRVVAATAGETPSKLRRRVLLERAAYRLLTTRDGILAVAREAGYSSNEAFTRAFGRAYGASPSAWRARPGRIQLEAPNGVHFHPPGGLRLPARDEVTSIDGNRLDESFVDANCEPAQVFTYGGMLGHVLTFAAHRRALAIGALHSAGITDLGPGDPMRWVSDEAA